MCHLHLLQIEALASLVRGKVPHILIFGENIMAGNIWLGAIRFGLINIPVSNQFAVDDKGPLGGMLSIASTNFNFEQMNRG